MDARFGPVCLLDLLQSSEACHSILAVQTGFGQALLDHCRAYTLPFCSSAESPTDCALFVGSDLLCLALYTARKVCADAGERPEAWITSAKFTDESAPKNIHPKLIFTGILHPGGTRS